MHKKRRPESRLFYLALKLYNKSYFEAGRSPKNRSILGVCKDFAGKPDAKIALFDYFNLITQLYQLNPKHSRTCAYKASSTHRVRDPNTYEGRTLLGCQRIPCEP